MLFTSGYSESGIFDHGVLHGSDDILNKPYRKEELAQKVRDVLEGHNAKERYGEWN